MPRIFSTLRLEIFFDCFDSSLLEIVGYHFLFPQYKIIHDIEVLFLDLLYLNIVYDFLCPCFELRICKIRRPSLHD